MTVVDPEGLEYRDLPGRLTADPFAAAGRGESTVRQVVIEPVPSRSPHVHPHSEEVMHVVSGRGQVWMDGTYHPLGPGSWCRIPAGTPHATLADPGERVALICFFPHHDLGSNIEELDMLLDGHTGHQG